MQTPAWNNGLVVKPAEMNLLNALAVALASWWADAFGQQNVVVPGGGTLTKGSGPPIVINYAAFTAYVNGPARLSQYKPGAGTVTLAAADTTYARYDLIVGTASQTTPVDSAGNPTVLDVLTVTKVTGVPDATPAIPNLPAYSVQLGYVLVPANATSAATCTITQALGPLSPDNFQDATIHRAASMASAVVHGFRATTPGGAGANQLAQTDANGASGRANALARASGGFTTTTIDGGNQPSAISVTDTNGNVGGANAVWDGTARRGLAGPGVGIPNAIPTMDANGRVADSNHLQGLVTGSGSGQIPVLDSNGAVAKAEQLVSAGVTFNVASGIVPLAWSAANGCTWSITYPAGVFGGRVPNPTYSIYDPASSVGSYGSGINAPPTAAGFTGVVGAASVGHSDHTIYLLWQAIG